jgi:antitoxin (DNA-binding transcriptional repressor) of toxin-antitoxin stability system
MSRIIDHSGWNWVDRIIETEALNRFPKLGEGVRHRLESVDARCTASEHLRKVRAGGSLTILDRDTPIARIVPWKAGDGPLKLRAPLPDAPKIQRVPLPPPLRLRGDIVKLLMGERQGDR